jgi:hypothetical protein
MPKQISAAPMLPGQGRARPPPELSANEKRIWKDVVESRPLHYFGPETWPLIRAYCMHAVLAQQLAAALRQESTSRLRDEHRRQTAMLCSLASKLRLAKMQRRKHQSTEADEIAQTPKRRLWVVPKPKV